MNFQPEYIFYFQDPNGVKRKLYSNGKGWESYTVTFGREENISNVVKSYTGDWTFVKEDADYLKHILFTKGVNYRIRLIIQKLNDWKTNSYKTEYSGFIDFTQSAFDDVTFSAPVASGGLFTLLENKWGESYDIKMDKQIDFDGAIIPESAEYLNYGYFRTNQYTSVGSQSRQCVILLGQKIQNDSERMFKNAQSQAYPLLGRSINEDSAFLVVKSGKIGRVKIDYTFNFSFQIGTESAGQFLTLVEYSLCLFECDYNTLQYHGGVSMTQGNVRVIASSGNILENITQRIGYNFGTNTFEVTPTSGGKVYWLFLRVSTPDYVSFINNQTSTLYYSVFNTSCYLNAQVNVKRAIQSITPSEVFKSLINNINVHGYPIYYDLNDFESVADRNFLTCGIGLRGFKAERRQVIYDFFYLQTSLQNFLDFIRVVYNYKLGIDYDQETDRYKVYLHHNDTFYSSSVIKRIDRVNNVQFSVDRDKLYSAIRCGYETKDDSLSGRNEYNCIFNWATPNTEIEENILELVSPYSASVYDIETYIYDNYGNFDDGKDKDNEIFVISCTEERGRFILDRSTHVTEGGEFPETLWNLKLTPKRILQAHRKELNSFLFFSRGKQITLNTCERWEGLDAGGVNEAAPVVIENDLIFQPVIIDLSASGNRNVIEFIERNRLGVFEFEYSGRIYRGHIAEGDSSISIQPMNEQESDFRLLAHKNNSY